MVKVKKSLMAIGGNIENMSRILKRYEQNDNNEKWFFI